MRVPRRFRGDLGTGKHRGRKKLNLSGSETVRSGVDRGHRSPRQALVGKALVYSGAEALSATVRAWLGAAGRPIVTGHPA